MRPFWFIVGGTTIVVGCGTALAWHQHAQVKEHRESMEYCERQYQELDSQVSEIRQRIGTGIEDFNLLIQDHEAERSRISQVGQTKAEWTATLARERLDEVRSLRDQVNLASEGEELAKHQLDVLHNLVKLRQYFNLNTVEAERYASVIDREAKGFALEKQKLQSLEGAVDARYSSAKLPTR
jgi:hypothetical protein